MIVEPRHKGAQSELIGAAYLLDQGYAVFRNVSAHGIIDLVGVKNGIAEFFDVKSDGNSGGLNSNARAMGVKRLVCKNDGTVKIHEIKIKPFKPSILDFDLNVTIAI
jgi:Holliday junction resolvase-like predicted endonuclease